MTDLAEPMTQSDKRRDFHTGALKRMPGWWLIFHEVDKVAPTVEDAEDLTNDIWESLAKSYNLNPRRETHARPRKK